MVQDVSKETYIINELLMLVEGGTGLVPLVSPQTTISPKCPLFPTLIISIVKTGEVCSFS